MHSGHYTYIGCTNREEEDEDGWKGDRCAYGGGGKIRGRERITDVEGVTETSTR